MSAPNDFAAHDRAQAAARRAMADAYRLWAKASAIDPALNQSDRDYYEAHNLKLAANYDARAAQFEKFAEQEEAA